MDNNNLKERTDMFNEQKEQLIECTERLEILNGRLNKLADQFVKEGFAVVVCILLLCAGAYSGAACLAIASWLLAIVIGFLQLRDMLIGILGNIHNKEATPCAEIMLFVGALVATVVTLVGTIITIGKL